MEKLMVTVTRHFVDGSGDTRSAVGDREQLGQFIADAIPMLSSVLDGAYITVQLGAPPRVLSEEARS
jgi:hypothetical protein